ISSASSTARWMDCTVDSMLTTTPFFRPREVCEPKPSTSMEPSRPTSPTSDTTLEVPMSRPTIRFRSERLSIPTTVFFSTVRCPVAPADRKSIRVTHVDIGNIVPTLCHEFRRRIDEFVEALVDLPPAQTHRYPGRQIALPRAARIEPERRHAQAERDQPALRREVALRDLRHL